MLDQVRFFCAKYRSSIFLFRTIDFEVRLCKICHFEFEQVTYRFYIGENRIDKAEDVVYRFVRLINKI